MQRRIRQVFTSFREHTCVSYAKIATIGGFCDIDFTIVKATCPNDIPISDKYVHEILKIFTISQSSHRAFALSFSRRFGKTKSWRVALKCLVLLHRLLRSAPDESRLRAELLWTRTNGLLSLYPCNFHDSSSYSSEDYTAFIRSYARLLDEALDCDPIGTIAEEQQNTYLDTSDYFSKVDDQEPDEQETVIQKMKYMGRMIEILPQLQSLMDRAIECRPKGAAARSFLVQSAMRHIIRDSFTCYTAFRSEIVVILDNLIQLPYRSCVAAFGIYKKASIQAEQLAEFHDWCKLAGHCGSYEYPFIDRIPEMQIRALETFLNGMWQLTDQSSSSNISTFTSNMQSPTSSIDKDSENGETRLEPRLDQVVKKDIEMEPLIQWDVFDQDHVGWEELLEASISGTCMDTRNNRENGYCLAECKGWQLQEYNPYHDVQAPNPFNQQPQRINIQYGSCPTTPMHSWGL